MPIPISDDQFCLLSNATAQIFPIEDRWPFLQALAERFAGRHDYDPPIAFHRRPFLVAVPIELPRAS
jgi:hypothetical protein